MMMPVNIVYILVYLTLSAVGLYKLKAAETITSIPFVIGFLFYVAGFLMWLFLLRRLPLSIIFPIAAGGLIIATHLTGWFLLNEKITIYHGVGCGLILSGIFVIYSQA